MDYKSKLDKLVANETSQLEVEKSNRNAYNDHQREVFAPLSTALREISESVDSSVASFTLHQGFAKVQIGARPSSYTRYEVEPNSVGFFRDRKPAPGFKITTTTTYPNSPDGEKSFENSYILQSTEEVMDDLLKLVAKKLAARSKRSDTKQ